MSRRHLIPHAGLAFLVALSIIGSTAQAATYYWDPGANPTAGGSGTWENSVNNYWSTTTSGAGTAKFPTSGTTNQAEFYGGSGTVGINGTQSLQALLFDAGTNYTLTTGSLATGAANFNNTASTIGVAGTGIINVPISTVASTSLTITGVATGKLTLGGASTFGTSSSVTVSGSQTVVVTNAAAFGSGTTTWNIAPDNGYSTLYLQSGSIPAGQVLINTAVAPVAGPDAYNQLGNFTIVTDATSPSSTGVTYAAGAATLAVANSTYTGNTANVGRTMTVSGGSNVNGGTAGLSFTSFQVDVQTTGTGTPYPSYYAPVTFNIQNPDGTGVTLLSIGTLNLSNQIVNGTNIGYGYGNLVLTGNGNFSVTSGLTGGASTAASLTLAPAIPARPTSRALLATSAPQS